MRNLKEMGRLYPSKIITLLEKSDVPLDIERIRKDIGIGNWNTALKHCLELVVEGKIKGMKTSKGWIFWKNPCNLDSGVEGKSE